MNCYRCSESFSIHQSRERERRACVNPIENKKLRVSSKAQIPRMIKRFNYKQQVIKTNSLRDAVEASLFAQFIWKTNN